VSPRQSNLRIGDQVEYRGRRCEVFGFTPMSVTPPRVLLQELATRKLIGVEATDLGFIRAVGGDADTERPALRRLGRRR
jgi:hypothetical protein